MVLQAWATNAETLRLLDGMKAVVHKTVQGQEAYE